MPKSRRSSIANRGDIMSPLEELEMSNRLEQRLIDADEIDIMVFSQTRGIQENVQVNFHSLENVSVISESGNEYIVDSINNTCTCPDFVHRQQSCRHLEAVDLAREEVGRGTFIGSSTNEGTSTNQVIGELINNEIRSELSNIQNEYIDDSFFYSENESEFQNDLERLINEPVPYYYENVLNGSNITFGIELEFIDGDSNAIANELYELNLCGNRTMQGYHSVTQPGMWKVERDGSVTSGNRGGEIISPILTDSPETWIQIEKICEVAKRHGAKVNYKTGGHVHVGAADTLDGKRQRWRRFFKAATGFEETFLRLAGGEQRRFRDNQYTPSSIEQNRRGISRSMPAEGSVSEFQNIVRDISRGKYQSINLSTFNSSKKTVEFRAFNGSLTPGIIQANVKYAAGMINTAEKSKLRQSEGRTCTPSGKKRAQIINEYNTNNERTDKGMIQALDAIFSRKEDKLHIMSVLAKNSWA